MQDQKSSSSTIYSGVQPGCKAHLINTFSPNLIVCCETEV
jgi:hypothetical protein